MDKDFAARLKNFEAVWRRVQNSKSPRNPGPCHNCRKPKGKNPPGSRATRFL